MPVGVDELDSVELQERRERRFGLGAAVEPEGVADAVPRGREALFVAFGSGSPATRASPVAPDDAVADRAAVVLVVEPERQNPSSSSSPSTICEAAGNVYSKSSGMSVLPKPG